MEKNKNVFMDGVIISSEAQKNVKTGTTVEVNNLRKE